MKKLFVIIACLISLALAACSSGSDSQQTTKTKGGQTQKKTVFDGYIKDVNKAKDVQKKVDAAQKKLKEQIKQAEKGSASSR
ncbi:MAG TPA: hypothetical protein VFH85_01105 [Gammaproteobacteria bacterium]|nr:hypothetical protein [Gammaproteobacteria bacterium]